MTEDPTKTSKYLKGLDQFEPDYTATNWKIDQDDLVNDYRTQIVKINVDSLLHCVHKDGTQNSWDGRLGIYGPNGVNWKLTFELLEDTSLVRENAGKTKTTLLLITDEGTYGLTGRHIKQNDLYEDISHHERLSRFENKSWQKDRKGARKNMGSKGRGKFIFVGASKESTFFFMPLRKIRPE